MHLIFSFFLTVCLQCSLVLSKSIHISTRPWHTSRVTTANEMSDSDKGSCFGGLQCVNGQCRKEAGEFLISECICDSGWMGLVCDHRTDEWNFFDPTESRVHSNYTEVTTKSNFGNLQAHRQEITETGNARDNDDAYQVCSDNYTSHSEEERMCTAGLQCKFGTCSVDHQGTHIAFTCQCDKGAVGILCENKCCLDCGAHASCQLFPNGTQFCNCNAGFGGERCNVEQTTNIQAEKIDSARLAIIISFLVLAVFVLLTPLAAYVIWKVCGNKAKELIWNLKCHSNKDSSYAYDVLLWYHDNKTDDAFVKQVLLPVIDQSALTVHLYTGPEDKEETIENIMANSRQKIVLYTPDFIKTCSEIETRLYKNKFVYLCTKYSLQRFNLRIRLYGLLVGNVRVNCPDVGDKHEVKLFQEHFQSLLPKRTNNSKKSGVKTIQCV